MGKLWFVGAGPGHPDLITVRGRDLIQRAGAILYAGSLVDPGHLVHAPAPCVIADSSAMTLEEMTAWLLDQLDRQEVVVRLQTGDPSLYGAMAELRPALERAGVGFEVVPGVSSALAAAAAAQQPLTLPEVSQTVILTRAEGRTPLGPGESLRALAGHGATLCLFLSATLGEEIQRELTAAGWAADAPLLLVHRASYPDQRILATTLGELAHTLRRENLRGQTMILAGPVLAGSATRSRLYHPDFAHGCRPAASTPSESTP